MDHNIIEGFSLEGEFHSSGKFTLDVAKAKLKLARFQLAHGLFVAKWVQAGVALACQNIHVVWHNGVLRVKFRGQGPSPLHLQALVNGLEDPLQMPALSPEHSLLMGILGSQSQAPCELNLTWQDQQQTFKLTSLNGEVECFTAPGVRDHWLGEIVVSERCGCPAIRRILRERCAYSPVPIKFNGDELASPWFDPAAHQFRLAEAYHAGTAGQALNLPPALERMAWTIHQGGCYQSQNCPQPEVFLFCLESSPGAAVGMALALDSSLRGAGRLLWVQDGVIVETESLDLGVPGVLAVVCARDLRTDLSQFRLLRDDAYGHEVSRVKQSILLLLQKVRECSLPLRSPVRPGKPLEDWIKSLVPLSAAAVVGGMVFPWSIPLIVIGATSVAGLDAARRLLSRQAEYDLQESRRLSERVQKIKQTP